MSCGVIEPWSIGATPRVRDGLCTSSVTPDGLTVTTRLAGTTDVRIRPNSATTMNGRSGLPSGVGAPLPDGWAPNVVMTRDRLGTTVDAAVEVLVDERRRAERRIDVLVGAAELHLELDGADLERGLAVEVGALHLDASADRDRDRDLAEQPGVDRDAGGDAGVGAHRVVERVEEDDAVGAELDLRPGRAEVRRGLEVAARHHRFGREGEVPTGLDHDGAADRPLDAEAGHFGVAVAVEVGVVAAHREHELAGVGSLEPDDVGEPAGDPDVAVEQPRVVGELALHPQHAFRRGEAHHQGELDRDEGDLGAGEGDAGEAEQADVEAVADLDGDDGDALDDARSS